MKPTRIYHPLKTITLQYNSDAELSEFETNFIIQYQSLHDELLKIKQQFLQLHFDVEKKLEEIKAPKEGFEKLRTETRKYEAILGLAEFDIPQNKEHKINPHLFQVQLDEYKEVLDKYWIDIEPLFHFYNEAFERVNAFDEVFNKFDKGYSNPLFKNYESMEIDICSFDDDQNQFKDLWMDVYKLYEDTVDGYSVWIELHNKMATDINTLYNQIKKLFNYIRSIQNFCTDNKAGSFSSN